ncbi:RING U-box domain-containing protein [Klebsormidium nitens]|uniref:RING U-box domain-containing protein n=1 Tax=Klebsormidium nitens TaxID=105231 RepID=A0A1Y1IL67_KLENI|nr:RING U-box domain-containing protein [Klebsormidium nitens]|eukprot:GAQ88848.1 RING U-box domain-containing protein [Klebsormidium nitens]
MVVCKCRKATKLYCFVHKVPVCGECISAPEHAHCVVRTYSEWVIDGDYDWPPKCPVCQENLEESQKETVRLGCLHVLHVDCLEKHLQSFPPYTAPAGFVCPTCSVPLWPPKSIKDAGTTLFNNLKGALAKSSVANTLLGLDNPIPATSETQSAVPSVSSPLTQASQSNPPPKNAPNGAAHSEIEEQEASSSVVASSRIEAIKEAAAEAEAAAGPPQARTPYLPGGHPQSSPRAHQKIDMLSRERRNSMKVHSSVDVPEDYDEDVERKYARRGPWYLRTLQRVLPSSWTSAQVLPVTMPGKDHPRGDSAAADDLISGQRRRALKKGLKSFKLDMRRGLVTFAVLSSLATLLILYMRLAASIVTEGDTVIG